MQIVILEKNRDKKGTILERMVKQILCHLKYNYVATNEIGPGGNELDVVAEIQITSIGNVETYPVICECKAHDKPIDMNDWLKFLGKVYKETLRNSRTHGLLIALNNANGNVKGDIRNSDYKNIRLLTAEKLGEYVIECYNMASIKQVHDTIKMWTADVVSDISIAMHDGSPYWFIKFIDGKYTLLTKDVGFVDKDLTGTITHLISELTTTTEDCYFDIRQERVLLMKEQAINNILPWLVMKGKHAISQVVDMVIENSGNVIHPKCDEVIRCAQKLDFLIVEEDGISLKPLPEINFIDFYRTVLSLGIPSKLYNPFYYEHIDESLLDSILHLQGDIELTIEEKENVLFLIKHSPSALRLMLYPNKMFCPNVNVPNADIDTLKESVKAVLMQTLANCIEVDADSDIAMFLFDDLEIRDFSKQTLYDIVTKDGKRMSIPVSKRLYYIPFEDEKGGVVVQAAAHFIGKYDAKTGLMVGGKNKHKHEKTLFGIVKHKTGADEEFLALYQ